MEKPATAEPAAVAAPIIPKRTGAAQAGTLSRKPPSPALGQIVHCSNPSPQSIRYTGQTCLVATNLVKLLGNRLPIVWDRRSIGSNLLTGPRSRQIGGKYGFVQTLVPLMTRQVERA